MSIPYDPPQSRVVDPDDASFPRRSWSWFYLVTKGRISRKQYWLFLPVPLVVGEIAYWVAVGHFMQADTATILWTVLAMALSWPSIAVQVKRWHDLDESAWWVLTTLVPYVGMLVTILIGLSPGTAGDNRFGKDPVIYRDQSRDIRPQPWQKWRKASR